MGDYPKKEIEDLDKQIERIRKEEERRKAELRSKKAGKGIENFEIERKRKIIESITGRILLNLKHIKEMIRASTKTLEEINNDIRKEEPDQKEKIKDKSKSLSEVIICVARDNFTSYTSIKKDMKNTFKENNIIELFPDIIVNFSNFKNKHLDLNSFFSITRQELDILEYLKRFQ